MSQIERRFIVKAIAHPSTSPWPHLPKILQGYWDSPDHDILRVRVTDEKKAELVRKIGTGIERDPETICIDVKMGMWLYRTCPYRIEKTRLRTDDGWKVDTFTVPSGLIVAEKELSSPDEEVIIPEWMIGAVEVTNAVNNLDIAKLASAHPGGKFPTEHLTMHIPRIVLTGGPCSGKSSIMDVAAKELGDKVHCVPETATIVISLVGAKPPSPQADYVRFQQGIYRVQREFEALSRQQAISDGKELLLMDRGTLDGAAYFEGGRRRMTEVCHTSTDTELYRYDAVIILDVPPREVYEANAANNPARSETWEEAKALDRRIREAWAGHSDLFIVEDCASMKEKIARTMKIIRKLD